jgi:hypothetical protein
MERLLHETCGGREHKGRRIEAVFFVYVYEKVVYKTGL